MLIVSSARPLQARIINTLTRVSAKPELNSGPLIPWFLLGNRKRAFSCLFCFTHHPPQLPPMGGSCRARLAHLRQELSAVLSSTKIPDSALWIESQSSALLKGLYEVGYKRAFHSSINYRTEEPHSKELLFLCCPI